MGDFIFFNSIYQERVWGGDFLRSHFGRQSVGMPELCGEAWELVDRAEEQSLVDGGDFDGLTLHELWTGEAYREYIFGKDAPNTERFPLLCKILDAREHLSVQCHPTPAMAKATGDEEKDEFWYVARAAPGAKIFAGFTRMLTKREFASAINTKHLEDFLHSFDTQAGMFLSLPSGRVHALGAGNVIFEIQQNSDSTYRIFDWNRKSAKGKVRDLHVEQALEATILDDVKPEPQTLGKIASGKKKLISKKKNFVVHFERLREGEELANDGFEVAALVNGKLDCGDRVAGEGNFFIIPANCKRRARALSSCDILFSSFPKTL